MARSIYTNLFVKMMSRLFVSKYPLNGHFPLNGRVGNVFTNETRIWTCGLSPPQKFIVDTYKIDQYIFFIDFKDLYLLENWNIDAQKVDIIVRQCANNNDRQQQALYYIGTDYNLNIRVFFFDAIEDYL